MNRRRLPEGVFTFQCVISCQQERRCLQLNHGVRVFHRGLSAAEDLLRAAVPSGFIGSLATHRWGVQGPTVADCLDLHIWSDWRDFIWLIKKKTRTSSDQEVEPLYGRSRSGSATNVNSEGFALIGGTSPGLVKPRTWTELFSCQWVRGVFCVKLQHLKYI